MQEYIDNILEEAKKSLLTDDVPIGAIIVLNHKIIARGHNTREKDHCILGHAEINAINEASKKLNRWNLADCKLYVTLKPCSMCAEVIKQVRISDVYYLLNKLDYKKEYEQTNFVKIDDIDLEEKYHFILSDFFTKKR